MCYFFAVYAPLKEVNRKRKNFFVTPTRIFNIVTHQWEIRKSSHFLMNDPNKRNPRKKLIWYASMNFEPALTFY